MSLPDRWCSVGVNHWCSVGVNHWRIVARKLTIAGQIVLQLTNTTEVTGGFSGGPVWDKTTNRVVGMITATTDPDERWRLTETAFITPSEILRKICPELQISDICPYRGLAAFAETDAGFFFGRETLVADLVTHLRQNPRFLAVVGPSGSGKSSVVHAGLLPALHQDAVSGSSAWHVISFRPGSNPYTALADTELDLLSGDVKAAIRGFLENHPKYERLVILGDQFEELFALSPESMQTQFISDLLTLLNSELPVTIIFTLRADFYGHILRYSDFKEWLEEGLVNIFPLIPEELYSAIARPAQQVGLGFEPGLVELIVQDAGQVDHPLPLLESALTRLWEKRRDGLLLREAYSQIGQVTGAIGQWAEDIYSQLTSQEQQLTRQIFTRLVHYGEDDTGDTRRKRMIAELTNSSDKQDIIHYLVQKLANARLLVTDRSSGDDSKETAEIIHDALLREWSRLKRWLTKQREFYLWRQRLDERLQEWETQKGELLHDASLTEAERWLAERPDDLSQIETGYIQESVNLREQEQTARKRLSQHIRFGSTTIGVVFILMLAIFAWTQRNQAITQANLADTAVAAKGTSDIRRQEADDAKATAAKSASMAVAAEATSDIRRQEADDARATAEFRQQEALSRQLAAESINIVESQYDLALLLSLQAYNIADTTNARAALLDVLGHNLRLTTFLQYSNDIDQSLAFNPNGKMLATSTCQQDVRGRELNEPCLSEIRLWDVTTGAPIGQPHELPGYGTRLTFSPDGKKLAFIVNRSGTIPTVLLWDVQTQKLTDQSFNHNAGAIAFSPDGQTLASGGYDKKIKLWDISTSKQIGQPLIGHNDFVLDVAFSPDGTLLASGSADGLVLLWDLTNGQIVGDPLIGHTHAVDIAFSPDGKMLASAGTLADFLSGGDKLIVWDVKTHQSIFEQEIDDLSSKTDVAFSPNSTILALINANMIKLWDMATQQPLESLKGHTEPISNLAFSSDGVTLASSGWDGTVILWNLSKHVKRQLDVHSDDN